MTEDEETLLDAVGIQGQLDKFNDLEALGLVQNDNQKVASWEEAGTWLDDFDWHRGYPNYCLGDFADHIWEAFGSRHSAIEGIWCTELGFDQENIGAGGFTILSMFTMLTSLCWR